MPGFFVSNTKSAIMLKDRFAERYVFNKLVLPNERAFALRQTQNKFMQDKVFEETEELIIIVEGYLLNKADLFEAYGSSTVAQLVRCMLNSCGEDFFKDFRGCFSGAIYDKVKEKWIVFTNHIGDNPIFYCFVNGKFAAGSEVRYIIDFCREQSILLSFNESCAYQVLTFGFVASDDTYANEIRRLHGGDYIVVQNGTAELKKYHRFKKNPERFADMTEDDLLGAIDSSFRNSVKLEWDKDNEYNLEHLADLSGGLDSRMNIWVAHELKERHLTALTYSKSGYMDETISKEISRYWKDELIFKPLDDASFMYDIDENTEMLGGLSLYSGITGGKRLLNSLNLSIYGIEHTGMIGDVIIGSFYRNPKEIISKRPTGMYSEKLKNRLSESVLNLPHDYSDYEIYLLYVRGFHGACNTHLLRRNYTEVGSPFLNVDFIQLCLDIPEKSRLGHHLYKRWIMRYYPQAAKYKWEKTGGKITENRIRYMLRKLVKKGPQKLFRLLGREYMISDGMNPIDYWIKNDSKLKRFLDDYEQNAYSVLQDYVSKRLISDMQSLYKKGNANEKAMVLTVLASFKQYFGDYAIEQAD